MNASDDPWAEPASFEQDEPPSAHPSAAAASRPGDQPGPWASGTAPGGSRPGAREPGNPAGAGLCYLLHFDRPYIGANGKGVAAHYSGSVQTAADLPARLARHEQGRGARLLQVVKAAGITWRLARTWPGGRDRERQLKNQGGASRRCPDCGVKPRTSSARQEAAALQQPEAHAGAHSPGQPSEQGLTSRGRDSLAASAQRLAAPPAGPTPARERQPCEPSGPHLADMEAEP
jgi:hypothetical protein